MTSDTAGRASWRRRLWRVLFRAILFVAVLSVVPVVLFRYVDPAASAVMWQRYLAEGRAQTAQWVALEAISSEMALAVIAAEDQRFPEHAGFDADAISLALRDWFDGRPLRGASTITQQVARNLFLWQGRSMLRKALEAWYTVWLEALWPKRRILEVYLNIAETGPATFGVESAARRYFQVPAAALSRSQAALIAAVLPNPVRLRVDAADARVLARRDWIVRQMHNLGGTRFLDTL